MTSFRAINRSTPSPRKHTSGKRPLSDIVSRQSAETNRGEAPDPTEVVVSAKKIRLSPNGHSREQTHLSKARSLAVVVPRENPSFSGSKGKKNIAKAVAKAKKAMHAPRMKKDDSKSSTSEARRQQAPRAKKLMPSIEQSAQKRTASFTPDSSVDGESESDYTPSLAIMTPTSAARTPNPRSPRMQPFPDAESSGFTHSSSRTDNTPADIKEETTITSQHSTHLDATVASSPASPSIWDSPLRMKKYEEAKFVEVPKELFEYDATRKKLRGKEEALIAGKRRGKGKFVESKDKRKTEQVEQKGHQSQRPAQWQYPSLEYLMTKGPDFANEEPHASNQGSARRSPKGKSQDKPADRYKLVWIKTKDLPDIADVRSHPGVEARFGSSEDWQDGNVHCSFESQIPNEHLLRHSEHGRPLNNDWRKPYERRELCVAEFSRSCSCALLPEYFTSKPNRVPRLAQWPGGKLEFFEHVKQISCCRGSIHPPYVVDACRKMLRKQDYPNRGDEESLESIVESDHGFQATNNRTDDYLGRAQSSIPPPTFYGYVDSYLPGPYARSSSRSGPKINGNRQSMKALRKLPTLGMTLAVRERTKISTNLDGPSVELHSTPATAGNSPTPPDSSVLGKRHRADVPRSQISENSPQAEESVGARRNFEGPPEASSGRPEPPASFNARRARHQSAPVDLSRRTNTVNEHASLSQPEQSRHEHHLREISNKFSPNDVQLLNRKLDSVLERLSATATPVHSGPVQAATAPTAVTADGHENRAQQRNVTKRKRPSAAEWREKHPEFSSNVPVNLRKTEEQIIAIGRYISPYERHKNAPEAFKYKGGFRAEYEHLLDRTENGVLIWSRLERRRLNK